MLYVSTYKMRLGLTLNFGYLSDSDVPSDDLVNWMRGGWNWSRNLIDFEIELCCTFITLPTMLLCW